MKKITAGKIRRSLQRFSDYASDLQRSDMNTFDDRISLLMDYCENDEVFQVIDAQLRSVQTVSFQDWYQERLATRKGNVGSGELIFPTNIDERMSIMYQLLSKIRSGDISFHSFTHDFFATGGNRINSSIYAFNNTIVEPLSRELGYRFSDIEESLPENEKEVIPLGNVQIIYSAQNVIQQSSTGDNVSQNVNINGNDELRRMFSALKAELDAVIQNTEEKTEFIEIVDSAQSLLTEEIPKKTAAKKLLGTLPTLGDVGSLVSVILSAIALMG